jgi:hypothetical protein
VARREDIQHVSPILLELICYRQYLVQLHPVYMKPNFAVVVYGFVTFTFETEYRYKSC